MVKKIKKFGNIIERFLHGEGGQRFFNAAYSIGAAVVIWGALFKILHLPGGNTLLCIGMGTEIAMFILTAFDRPPREYAWEEVFPVLDSHNPEDRPDMAGGVAGGSVIINGGVARSIDTPDGESYPVHPEGESVIPAMADNASITAPGVAPGIQAVTSMAAGLDVSEEDTASLRESIAKMATAADQIARMADLTSATQEYLQNISGIAEQMQQLQQTTRSLNEVSAVLLDSYRQITENSETINANARGYVDSMEDLNRNIGGLNTIYEIQLKSVSSQLESIDRVNRGLKDIRDMYEKSAAESSRYCEETEKMARYMKQLNQVYEKMITAMTINMYNPMMGGAPRGENPYAQESDREA